MDKKTIKLLITGFKFFPSPVTVMIALLTMISGVIGYNSFVEDDPPAIFKAKHIVAVNDDVLNKTVLIYDCYVDSDKSTTIKLNRRIQCNDKSQYDLQQSVISIHQGSSIVSRYIPLPYKHLAGTKCVLTSNIEWIPSLSVKPHFFETESLPFIVDWLS